MSDKRPETVIRDNNIKASIWKNEGEKGTYYTTTLARTYKDKEGNYRDTNSFSQNDLLRVSEVAREAYAKSRRLQREQYQQQNKSTSRETSPSEQDGEQKQKKHAFVGAKDFGDEDDEHLSRKEFIRKRTDQANKRRSGRFSR